MAPKTMSCARTPVVAGGQNMSTSRPCMIDSIRCGCHCWTLSVSWRSGVRRCEPCMVVMIFMLMWIPIHPSSTLWSLIWVLPRSRTGVMSISLLLLQLWHISTRSLAQLLCGDLPAGLAKRHNFSVPHHQFHHHLHLQPHQAGRRPWWRMVMDSLMPVIKWCCGWCQSSWCSWRWIWTCMHSDQMLIFWGRTSWVLFTRYQELLWVRGSTPRCLHWKNIS